MNDDQWIKTTRSGGYRRRVFKTYRNILNIDRTITSGSENNLNQNDYSKRITLPPDCNTDEGNIIVSENEGSVPTDIIHKENSDSLSSDSDEIDNDVTNTNHINDESVPNFRNQIRTWALEHNISHSAIKSLALIINSKTPNLLPVDPRSLLKTPRKIITTPVPPGEYWHNGLTESVRKILQRHDSIQLDQISLCFNIDGLPVAKSSNQQFWPILGSIYELSQVKPFIVGIYAGPGKPSDPNKFLLPFVEELKELLEKGVEIEGRTLSILLRCFVCDSPARAMIKGVCNFNGKNGCLKCTTVGEYSHISHTVIFPDIDCPARNNEDFRNKLYRGHHKEDMESILLNLPIDIIETFPVADALHLIDLGVMKRLLIGWRDGNFGKKDTKWRAIDIQAVNTFLKSCKTPSEIHRSVRTLDHLRHWKGTEFRTFFLYLSVIILKDVLPNNAMIHFLTLFCAITICSNEEHFKFLRLAKELLKHFVLNFKVFYGIDYITSNVHNLTHVVDEVQRFGKLQSFDAYQYENKLYLIKKMLRQGNRLLSQAAKRLSEIEEDALASENLSKNNNDNYPFVKKNIKNHNFVLHLQSFILSAKTSDKYFLTNDNNIMEVKEINFRENRIYIDCKKIVNKENVFNQPINSSYLHIYKCKINHNSRIESTCFPEDVKCKFFVTEHKSELYLIPLLHTL